MLVVETLSFMPAWRKSQDLQDAHELFRGLRIIMHMHIRGTGKKKRKEKDQTTGRTMAQGR